MTDKIRQIEYAIAQANVFKSKLSPEALAVPMLGSLKIRHLLNNLGAISTHFLEVGSHVGGSYCSTVFGNKNLVSATAIDNFCEDFANIDAERELSKNASIFSPELLNWHLVNQDCFTIKKEQIQNNIDLYNYDGNHSEESQCKAITHFLPMMADEFILVVDDYAGAPEFGQVKEGTQRGIKESGVIVLYEQELITDPKWPNDTWHNGYYVALLRKP